MGFLFARGLFSQRRQYRKKHENYPHKNFHIYWVSEDDLYESFLHKPSWRPMSIWCIYVYFVSFSYIHRNITMRFLTCEPNLEKKEEYIDEADDFYNDPAAWLKQEYHIKGIPLPSHMVYFDRLQPDIAEFLTQSGYKHCGTFFHTHLPEGRVGTHVSVSCR